MEYCIINCTISTKQEAAGIAKELIAQRLIACCSIIENVTSVYRWNNKLNCDNEVLMVMKTKKSLYKQAEAQIQKLHPYEVPEIICIPVIEGSPDYLNWIKDQTDSCAEEEDD